MSKAVIGGIVGGCALIALAAIFAAIHYYRKWRRNKATQLEMLTFVKSEMDLKENRDSLVTGLDIESKYLIPRDRIEMDTSRILGAGHFGTILAGALVGGGNVAVKIPNSDHCTYSDHLKILIGEIRVMIHLGKHPNLVGFIGVNMEEIGRGVTLTVLQYCERGSLLSYLRGRRRDVEGGREGGGEVNYSEMVRFSFEIASGMKYIAEKKVVLGDLAARSVFLDSNFTCKISDFSLSRRLHGEDHYVLEEPTPLPWRWMAVESLKSMVFSSKSNVWSFGVTIWEIFSHGSVPFPGLTWTASYADDVENGMRLRSPTDASPEIYSMMCKCWALDPNHRPGFSQLGDFFSLLSRR